MSEDLGGWLHELRQQRGLALREVAEEVRMDLAQLQKIEKGLRFPTEEQGARLAVFYGIDEKDVQARRIAEKFRNDYAANPAARDAIVMIAEEAAVYGTASRARAKEKGGRRAHA